MGGAHAPRVRFPAPSLETFGDVFDEGVEHDSRGGCAPHFVRKDLASVWIWFYKEVAPMALKTFSRKMNYG
jgi:hypothetical protein